MKFFDKKDTNSPPQNENPVVPMAASPTPVPPPPTPTPPPPPKQTVEPIEPKPMMVTQRLSQTVIGSSLTIKGEVSADENITIEGVVEGSVQSSREVRVAPEGRVRATIRATNVTISGKVKGDIFATNKVDLSPAGQLEGNIRAPKLAIAETALFRGTIDMSSPVSDGPLRFEKEKKMQADPELVKK